MKNRIFSFITLFWCFGILQSKAQLPVCDIVYGRYGYDSIANYNPVTGPSATNPSINSIGTPTGTSGLTIGPVLGSGSPIRTFYSVDLMTNNYIYYNPTTSSWVNTGHKCGVGVNIAAGGGYIFNLDGPSGRVYRYDGTGDATLLTTVSAFVGGAPYDLIADCEGSWYIFKQTGSAPFLAQYNAAGTLIKTWAYANPYGLNVRAAGGFAIIGDSIYTDDNYVSGGGAIATYVLGFDTVTLVKTSNIDKIVSNDLASCEGAAFANPIIEIKESVNDICFVSPVTFTSKSLGGGASPAYQWFVNGVLKGTGSSYSYLPINGDKVYCVLTSSSSCAVTATDTSNIILMNTPGPKVTSPVDLCIGALATPLTAAGVGLKWYSTASGGTGTVVAPTPNTGVAGTILYYVSQSCPAPILETPRSVISVTVHPLPVITISPSTSPLLGLCKIGSLLVRASSPLASVWQWDSAGITLPGAIYDSLMIKTTGRWGISLTDVYGCQSHRDIDVVKDTIPLPVLYPVESFICLEGSALLTCSPGFLTHQFEWIKDGSLISSPTIHLWNASVAGNYAVKVTNALGCIDTTNLVKVLNYPAPAKPVIINLDPYLEIPPAYMYYQWFVNGVRIVGANKNSYLTTAKGNYHVEVTDANGCINQSDTLFIGENSAINSVDLFSKSKIYPNPTNGMISIDAPAGVNVLVLDVMGKEVCSGKELLSVNLLNQPDGIYVIKLFDMDYKLLLIDKIVKTK